MDIQLILSVLESKYCVSICLKDLRLSIQQAEPLHFHSCLTLSYFAKENKKKHQIFRRLAFPVSPIQRRVSFDIISVVASVRIARFVFFFLVTSSNKNVTLKNFDISIVIRWRQRERLTGRIVIQERFN